MDQDELQSVHDLQEEIRPVIIDGVEMTGYYVSNTGKVFSCFKSEPLWSNSKLTGTRKIITENKKELSSFIRSKTSPYLSVCIHVRDNKVDYDYKNGKRMMYVHQLVMEAFKPILENPPERLKECWNDLPLEAKKWISECAIINHKDHNSYNNHISNLEYVTPRENSRKAIAKWGAFNSETVEKKLNKNYTTTNKSTLVSFFSMNTLL